MSHSGLWSSVARKWYPWLAIGRSCHVADNGQMRQKQWCPLLEDFVMQQTLTKCGPKCAPHRRTLSRSGLWPNVAQNVPLVGGLYHSADFDQMSPKMCPLSEDFVMQRPSTKCGPKCAPRWRTLSCTSLRPNVAQSGPLIGRLCHTADFDQMWPKMCPLLEDFVTQRTSTKYGPNMCPLTDDFVLLRGPTTYGLTIYSSSKNMPGLCKRILIIDQCRTKTAISDYNAMWSIC